MDLTILEDLYANLSLDDEEPPTLIAEEAALVVELVCLDLCLVGKVFSTRMINRKAFCAGMARLWGQDRCSAMESIGRSHFIFFFPF